MIEPDDLAKKAPTYQIGQKIDELSVSDLAETIEILETEVIRLKAAKESKSKHLDAAAALFGPKS